MLSRKCRETLVADSAPYIHPNNYTLRLNSTSDTSVDVDSRMGQQQRCESAIALGANTFFIVAFIFARALLNSESKLVGSGKAIANYSFMKNTEYNECEKNAGVFDKFEKKKKFEFLYREKPRLSYN